MPPQTPAALDLRGLDPPEPLVRILGIVEGGSPGPHLFLLAREPRPLYALLAAQGWGHAVRHLAEGVELQVFRAR
jgi:hypothetical protein